MSRRGIAETNFREGQVLEADEALAAEMLASKGLSVRGEEGREWVLVNHKCSMSLEKRGIACRRTAEQFEGEYKDIPAWSRARDRGKAAQSITKPLLLPSTRYWIPLNHYIMGRFACTKRSAPKPTHSSALPSAPHFLFFPPAQMQLLALLT